MRIAGLQKLTLLDYPGKTAATVFTPGCNLRCPFCHNGELVEPPTGSSAPAGLDEEANRSAPAGLGDCTSRNAPADRNELGANAPGAALEDIPVDDVLAFLRTRRGLLDGVCVSGGEPLLQPHLAAFCRELRALGFAVKIDTNGTLPDRLRALLDEGLADYVALDAKNAPQRYAETVGVADFDPAPVRASMRLLMDRAHRDAAVGGIDCELRTTVARELHGKDDLLALARWIADEARDAGAPAPSWFVQNFKDSDTVLAGPGALHPWPESDLRALLPELRAILPTAQLRGID